MGGPGKTGATLPIKPTINKTIPMTIRKISIIFRCVNVETKVYKKKIPLGEESGYFHKNSKMNFA